MTKITNLTEKRFIKCIQDNGFDWDDTHQSYTRLWETKTSEGKLQCVEMYKQENSEWKQIMIGSDGNIFFEENINLDEHIS
tara:strand:+ start:230 stop:472 length:243 start_codon:yes stop_codon:yes gene_type:complete